MADMSAPVHFRVSPRVLGPLGAEQLQDPALAVLELIKNAWDADARRVDVRIATKGPLRHIVVTDDGCGMSETDFRDRWLVIGASDKRSKRVTPNQRPLIGEKGLGRLATFALGRTVRVASKTSAAQGFRTRIDWDRLLQSNSLEEYPILLGPAARARGTRVEIASLSQEWTANHTNYLVSHAELLTAIPGETFKIAISVNGKKQLLARSESQIAKLSEATLEMIVDKEGSPSITSCTVNGSDLSNAAFRLPADKLLDPRLAGMTLKLRFFRRDEAVKRLGRSLQRNLNMIS